MNVAELVRLALLIVIFGIMCLILLDRKYSLKKTLIIFGSFITASIAVNAFIFFLFGWKIYSFFYVPVTNGFATIGLLFLSKRKGLPVIFNMLTATVLANISSIVAGFIRLETGWSVWSEILIRTVISIPLMILLYYYLRPSYLKMLTIMKKYWGYLCLMPGLYYIIVIINMIDFSSAPSDYRRTFMNIFLSLAITAVVYGVIFALFTRVIRETEMRDAQQLLRMQMQALEQQFEIQKENEEKVNICRHDLRHYIAEIKVLIESGNTEEALHVLRSFDEQQYF